MLRILILELLSAPLIDPASFGLQDTIYFNFSEFYYRITQIFFYIFVFLIQNPIFLLTLPLMIISIKCLSKNPLNKTILLFSFVFFSFTFFAYFFKVIEIEFQLRYSLDEFLFSVSGIYLLVFANFLNEYLLNNKNL